MKSGAKLSYDLHKMKNKNVWSDFSMHKKKLKLWKRPTETAILQKNKFPPKKVFRVKKIKSGFN